MLTRCNLVSTRCCLVRVHVNWYWLGSVVCELFLYKRKQKCTLQQQQLHDIICIKLNPNEQETNEQNTLTQQSISLRCRCHNSLSSFALSLWNSVTQVVGLCVCEFAIWAEPMEHCSSSLSSFAAANSYLSVSFHISCCCFRELTSNLFVVVVVVFAVFSLACSKGDRVSH